jgi:Cu-processing system permease protein
LSYPVGRAAVIGGKFLGHTAILAVATAVGYGAAGVALAMRGGGAEPGAWLPFVAMAGSSLMLGMVFIALGYLASVLVGDPRTAGAIVLGLWLFFTVIYDIALLGLLVADQGRTITIGMFNLLLLGNPTDIYRLFNLAGLAGVRTFAGMAGLASELRLAPAVLLSSLVVWTAVPLAAATLLFARREL